MPLCPPICFVVPVFLLSSFSYCKGADNVILERVNDHPQRLALLNEHATSFAKEGLRTLVLATRRLSAEEFQAWKQALMVAAATPTGPKKDEANARVAALVEQNLEVGLCLAARVWMCLRVRGGSCWDW